MNIKAVENLLKRQVCWRPVDFPEDMSDDNAQNELESQGTELYYAFKEAKNLLQKELDKRINPIDICYVIDECDKHKWTAQETLANVSADGLTLEQAYNLYNEAKAIL